MEGLKLRYCVIKHTTKTIDGSENPNEIMLENAKNLGLAESEVEILTEEEYQARKALEPIPPQPPNEMELLRNKITEQERTMEELMFVVIPDILGGGGM
jgi:hypothetical protein